MIKLPSSSIDLSLSEADTRAKLINPALYARGWTEEMIRREETAGTIEIVGGKARRRARGQVDYTLRLKVTPDSQPVAVAIIEAKKAGESPAKGLEQAKAYAHSQRLNVPFVFCSPAAGRSRRPSFSAPAIAMPMTWRRC